MSILNEKRIDRYREQNGTVRLTPRQRRRVDHKDRRSIELDAALAAHGVTFETWGDEL